MKTIISQQLRDLTGNTEQIGNFHVKNQFLISYEHGTGFQSYNSLIAVKTGGKTYIGKNYNYSGTTKKYLSKFLNETHKETQSKIDKGIYIMIQD